MHAGVQWRYKSWLAWWTHGVTAHALCDSKTQAFHCHDRWTIQVHRLMKRIKRSEAGRMQCEWQQAWPTLTRFWDWAMAAAAGLDVHLHPLDLASARRILQQFGHSVFVLHSASDKVLINISDHVVRFRSARRLQPEWLKQWTDWLRADDMIQQAFFRVSFLFETRSHEYWCLNMFSICLNYFASLCIIL